MNAEPQITERRREIRFKFQNKVYLQNDNEFVGYAENVHMHGMMLVSPDPLPELEKIQIWFASTTEENETDKIFISAYRVWQSITNDGARLYCSGLHFEEPDEEIKEKLHGLILSLDEYISE